MWMRLTESLHVVIHTATLKKKDGRILNMTVGAGVSRTIWWDFRFSGQPKVLEFLPIKLYFLDQTMACFLLKPVPVYVIHAPAPPPCNITPKSRILLEYFPIEL